MIWDPYQVREIILVGHTHHDLGYTNSPQIIDEHHRHIVSEVLRLCAADPEPGPARFRWTFEVARPASPGAASTRCAGPA